MHPVFNNFDIVSQIFSYTLGQIENTADATVNGYNHWVAYTTLWRIGHICHSFRDAVKQQLQGKLVIRISTSPNGAAFRGKHVYGATSIPMDSLNTSLVRKVILQFDKPPDRNLFVAKLLDLFETRDWRSLRYVSMCQRYHSKLQISGMIYGEELWPTNITKRVIALVPSINRLRVEHNFYRGESSEELDRILGQRAATLQELTLNQIHWFDLSQLSLPSLTVLDISVRNVEGAVNELPQLCITTLRKLVLRYATRRDFISSFSDKTGAVSVFSELEYLHLDFGSDRDENMDIDGPRHVGMFSFPKLRHLRIYSHCTKLRYFFQNFVRSPLVRLHFCGCCDSLKDIDFSVFRQLEDLLVDMDGFSDSEAEEIHRQVMTAGMPLRFVELGIRHRRSLSYVKPTGCSLVRKYKTVTVMDAAHLSEALVLMPALLQLTFWYRSASIGRMTVEELVGMLTNFDLSPLNSKLQILRALEAPNTASIDGNSMSVELAELILVIARLPMLQTLEINADPTECELLLRQIMEAFQSKGLGQGLDHFGSLQVIRAHKLISDMFD